MSPLEAVLSGAAVVGYTGQGAREYFKKPNLVAVQNGDFKKFILKVSQAIKAFESGLLETAAFEKGRKLLVTKYELENELWHLKAFVKWVEMAF